MSEKKTTLSRRKFLVTVSAGGAAGAAALVARQPGAPSPQAQAGDGKRSGAGYQLTQHVNNYYRTTKV
jgi:hypothetical protein